MVKSKGNSSDKKPVVQTQTKPDNPYKGCSRQDLVNKLIQRGLIESDDGRQWTVLQRLLSKQDSIDAKGVVTKYQKISTEVDKDLALQGWEIRKDQTGKSTKKFLWKPGIDNNGMLVNSGSDLSKMVSKWEKKERAKVFQKVLEKRVVKKEFAEEDDEDPDEETCFGKKEFDEDSDYCPPAEEEDEDPDEEMHPGILDQSHYAEDNNSDHEDIGCSKEDQENVEKFKEDLDALANFRGDLELSSEQKATLHRLSKMVKDTEEPPKERVKEVVNSKIKRMEPERTEMFRECALVLQSYSQFQQAIAEGSTVEMMQAINGLYDSKAREHGYVLKLQELGKDQFDSLEPLVEMIDLIPLEYLSSTNDRFRNLVSFLDKNDTPEEKVITNRLDFQEMSCRMTWKNRERLKHFMAHLEKLDHKEKNSCQIESRRTMVLATIFTPSEAINTNPFGLPNVAEDTKGNHSDKRLFRVG